MRIGIGIDTGGTYTDAVIYDFEKKVLLGKSKALTTKNDLSEGILEALDALPKAEVRLAEMISLSTTLATNACVEDKGGAAKLVFFGGHSKTIDEVGAEYGLPKSDEIMLVESHTDFSGFAERETDWNRFRRSIFDEGFEGLDGVGIVEVNAIKNGAASERKAKEIIEETYSIPVVCGHELFNEMNCLRRGASTLLNARLFPVIREFMAAIIKAVRLREIKAEIVIVRSDGSMMSEAFARTRPVETLLCGPAASVMGSARLTGEPNAIVVDMGGTTTDIALISDGVPLKVTNGVSVGKWKTFVGGLYIKTFGLGGDSAIHYGNFGVYLEEYRVVPICEAASRYPQIKDNLTKLLRGAKKHTKFLHEHFIAVKDISNNPRYSEYEKKFCRNLSEGPLILRDAAARMHGTDIYTLDVAKLIKDGAVVVCGLTPTDIMHLKGDFTKFPAEASLLAAEYVALNAGLTVAELCDTVYDEIKRKLYVNIVKAMLEIKNEDLLKKGVSDEVARFIAESYEASKTDENVRFVSMRFGTDFTLTGVGAPIHLFLPEVAKALGTRAVMPEHFEVANAVGSIIGNIYAVSAVEIKPNYTVAGTSGYTVYGPGEAKIFGDLDEAENYAIETAKKNARAEAVNRGARGDVSVSCKLVLNEAKGRDCVVHLGTKAVANAVGSAGA
ncbi:MAG: hydantoinase/oxoprolinase family protein [Defluviitaleaceae bacterium]|nr:hydantoinase/oxoprolinase family protein [Defluviitaleaceae bacterium]